MSNTNQAEEQKAIDDKIEALKNSKFKQQMLPAWRPVPSFGSTMITFGLFGIVFLGLGIMLYVLSDKIQEVKVQYDLPQFCGSPVYSTDPNKGTVADVAASGDTAAVTKGSKAWINAANQHNCTVNLTVVVDMKQPVFVYYQLDNFYQNHRRYVKSRDYQQLMGTYRSAEDVKSTCDPILTNANLLNMGISKSVAGTELDQTKVATPCGLIAKSFFNDSYTFDELDETSNYTNQAGAKVNKIKIDDSNIAWDSDVTYKFKNQKEAPKGWDNSTQGNWTWEQTQWTDITNQHFIVWMRTAGLPNFRKLFGKIDQDLKKGTYQVNIINNYNVADFEGSKSFVLSTTNMLGGQNYFLAVCYIIVGALCIVFAIIFFVAYMRKQQLSQKQAGGSG